VPKTPEEQAFWDMAFCAAVNGNRVGRDGRFVSSLADCAETADRMLLERRKRTEAPTEVPNAPP
jgi:hypothetical protein